MLLEESFNFDDERIVYELDPDMTPVESGQAASTDLSQISAVGLGEFAQVGDWRVRVIEVTPDATDIVLTENRFNDPPEDGNQFFVATLEAEYSGTDSETFWIEMTWKAVGPSAVAYETGEASCGVIPDSIRDAGETFPGGVITGNICWSVSTADASDLVMLLEESFNFDDEERTVYRLTGVS